MGQSRDTTLIVKRIKKMNNFLLLNALAICAISLATIYSATISRTATFFRKEIIWLLISICAYILFSFIDYKKYGKYYKIIYLFNVLLLISVYVVGITRKGASRWIGIGSFTVQPSEFAKLFIILTFAEFLVINYRERFDGMKSLIYSGLHVLPIFILILNQPDLGTSLVLMVIYVVLIFVHGIDWKLIVLMIFSVIVSVPIVYFLILKDYQKMRIITFLNPEANLLDSGWNVIQSMIAIGSGGIYGKGFMNNTQSKLRFLPESHTDFIGSVFLEERGLIGGIILLGLYFILLMQILQIADTTEDKYGKLICYGIASIFFFHIVVNIGMTMGIMPVTGLPLLFMSYGGSSLLFSFMMLGIVQSVKIYRGE
ncbi:MAG: rod shape-determining protein RodA [Fusobacteriaceae bacterium]|jgi:rod shape determining protein RodA|nr:rod shape-determining protein RodA [Fusobacteriaceae bacterium]